MTNQEITDAIFYLVPSAEFSFTEIDLDSLQWHTKDVDKPSQEAILAAIPVAKAQIEADKENVQSKKQALLDRLGITADEAALLLG
jgi:hypothetical protein